MAEVEPHQIAELSGLPMRRVLNSGSAGGL